MTPQDLHKLFLPAAIEAARQGATAREMSDYLIKASAGMAINAGFHLSQENLLRTLTEESGSLKSA